MPMTHLTSIIAKALALTDGLLGTWATAYMVKEGECNRYVVHASLNECGRDFAASLSGLVTSTVEFCNSLLVGLGAVGP